MDFLGMTDSRVGQGGDPSLTVKTTAQVDIEGLEDSSSDRGGGLAERGEEEGA